MQKDLPERSFRFALWIGEYFSYLQVEKEIAHTEAQRHRGKKINHEEHEGKEGLILRGLKT